jgi:hypothetical protein
MKPISFLFLAFAGMFLISSFKWSDDQTKDFTFYFESKALRIDFELYGNANTESFILKQIKKQEIWAGSNRISNGLDLNLGTYRFSVLDSASNKLLYTQGFCSLFNEWQSTPEAKLRTSSYYHVNLLPFPKHSILYRLEKRKYDDGKFYTIHEEYINPENYFIINEAPEPIAYKTVQGGSDINHKIDIAFIAEGYSESEMKKFISDVTRIWNYISAIPPFDKHKEKFNIYAIESVSAESGTDIPGEYVYKNTVLNSSFYTFNTDRYLTSSDLKSMHDIAAVVPYDHLFVLINSERYGGGGFYNYYSATTVDNEYSEKVAIHEFGHGFAGLGDEYYESGVAFDGYYNLNVEPWEPNITTLVAFETKWKDMIPDEVNIPTERTYNYRNTVGVYEGGGYSSKGIYSPFQDCRMKSNVPDGFCPVCTRAIEKSIDFYTK